MEKEKQASKQVAGWREGVRKAHTPLLSLSLSQTTQRTEPVCALDFKATSSSRQLPSQLPSPQERYSDSGWILGIRNLMTTYSCLLLTIQLSILLYHASATHIIYANYQTPVVHVTMYMYMYIPYIFRVYKFATVLYTCTYMHIVNVYIHVHVYTCYS